MSSIIFKREQIKFFEEDFGKVDYDWILRMTEGKRTVEVDPVVIRHVDGKNLSLDPEYRKIDYYYALMTLVSCQLCNVAI